MSLVVYKSSAGSGKTHTLVQEYLKITLDNPDKFRRVLAITFTNKAAGEMKERIITTLKTLSSGDFNNKMAETLQAALNITEVTLQSRAVALLTNIIHHFEDFGISTIDSFVHRIIRTFATDVKLPYGFEVVIDNEDIIPDIIEDLYSQLGENKELTEIMVAFVLSLADDERSYNPENSLIDFINKQTQEDGFEEIKKLSKIDLKRFMEILWLLNSKLKKIKEKINGVANDALMLIETNGIDHSMFGGGKSGIASYFRKNQNEINAKSLIPLKKVLDTIEQDKWHASKAKVSDKAAIDTIKEDLITYYHTIKENGEHYLFLKMVYDKLYAVALIKEIRLLFDEFTFRTNKVHISEFNKKISDTIAGQPTPFIYERLGNRYDHFLIDEFQDTSLLQWYNLFPLIENSLALGNFNMLVGDAKQAIYRFRSGEVELFTSLPKLYGNPDLPDKTQREAVLEHSFIEKNLDTNYRSYKEIVGFNNNFFPLVIKDDSELIRKIYHHHEQKVFTEKNYGGYVSIQLIKSENKEDYREKRLAEILNYVTTLRHKGFSAGDICVLTRTNSDATEIATFLLANDVPVISSESLLLTGSAEVRATVAFFKAVLQPDNGVVLAEILENLLIIKGQSNQFDILSKKLLQDKENALSNILLWADINVDLELLKQKPLYLLAEAFYNLVSNNQNPNIYFQYFLDFILEKETLVENRPDAFIELWEQKKKKLFITLPEGEDAVQIMTIHKAKGLKFQVVILDLQVRKEKSTKDVFWSTKKIEEAPDLTTYLLPINKEKLTAVGMEEVYEQEKAKSRLDFINMVYVAFTRPVEALFLMADVSNKEFFSKDIVKFLKESGQFSEDKKLYTYGELQKLEVSEVPDRNHVLLSQWQSNGGDFPVEIAPAEEIYWEMVASATQRTKGKVIHEILSHIKTAEDIDKTLNYYITNGIIDSMERTGLNHKLQAVLNHPQLEKYFSQSVLVKNETEIVLPNGEVVRPDRVVISNGEVAVIDYKTGEKEEEHLLQVGEYKQAFEMLGFQQVNGLLVYLSYDVEVVAV